MSDQQNVDKGHRNLLIVAPVAGGIGGVTVATPFACAFTPFEKVHAADASVEADVSDLVPDQIKVMEWRGKPAWLLKRTPDMLGSLKKIDNRAADSELDVPFTMKTPDYCKNETRSRVKHKDLLVMAGICSHLDCSPSGPSLAGANVQLAGDPDFACPCYGSMFDLVNRVLKNESAPRNLDALPYMLLSDMKLVIGKDRKGET